MKSGNPNKSSQEKQQTGLAARKVAANLLGAVLDDKKSLDQLVDPHRGVFAYNSLIAKDRALIRAILMCCLRRKGQIDDALLRVLDRKTPKRARHLNHSLSVAAAQILFLDVPDRAAVDLAVTAVAEDSRTNRFASLTNAVLRRLSREKVAILADQQPARLCMAGWIYKRCRKAYGKAQAEKIAEMHLEEAMLDLTVKSDAQGWADKFSGIVLPNGSVRLKQKLGVADMQGFSDGQWWVQDAAAALPAHLLGNVRGKSVADLCAAPGGKTAQLVQQGGQVTAIDISARRLERLRENLGRLNLEAKCVEADLLKWQPDTLFEAVLLDAPCSSTGTIRRHPDVMWNKSADDVAKLAELQFEMWNKAIAMVKPGGVIVFANCSIDRAEGEDLYARMLATRDDVVPEPIVADEVAVLSQAITGQGTLRTLPCHWPDEQRSLGGLDGFFVARLRRK